MHRSLVNCVLSGQLVARWHGNVAYRAILVATTAMALLVGATAGTAQTQPRTAASLAAMEDVPEGLNSGDWSSIRAAYEAHRHAAVAVAGGFQAHNPGQRWLTRFDGRGFTVQPDAGGWGWGLQLESYGFAGQERTISGAPIASAAGQRVAYDWDATLQEWYVNDTRGLEHGYTIRQRPPPIHPGPLMLTLAVRGDLQAQVLSDGRGVGFLNGDGTTVLTYAGLSVFDADGRVLTARFERIADGLLLTIDERSARYPLTIDPIVQHAYLKASNTGGGDQFGTAVSVSGDTVVVGAPGEDSSAKGVNGNQSDSSATASGAAYVFVRSGSIWSQQAYLKASNTEAGDQFGRSVSVSGDTVVVGAIYESSAATGVNGDQSNNSAIEAGAAYVFVRSGTTWSQQAYLKASNTGALDTFGWSVSVSGDTVVVGACTEDSNATGVNGNQSDNSAPSAGSAYVFVRSGMTWSQQGYLKASNTGPSDFFGYSVSVSDDTVVVGAFLEWSDATGVNGDESDNSAYGSGAAYVFARSGTSWSQQAYLKASNTDEDDRFGWSASVSGDTIVVGAPLEDSNSTGVNGDQSNSIFGNAAGAAYVFARSGASWSQQAYLKASNTEAGDIFGLSVSVSGDTIIVGADAASSPSMAESGSAYMFVRDGTAWSQLTHLGASNATGGDDFGISVSVSGTTIVVCAPGEDSDATGVNGDQLDNTAAGAGAAYVFDLPANSSMYLTTLVSATPDGLAGNFESTSAAISEDGKFIAFSSKADNLVAGDTNSKQDVFVRDRIAGQTSLVSVDSSGAAANSSCVTPRLSSDGRFVAFVSSATNLVPGDTNGFWDVFVRDRILGTTTRVSVSSTGAQANANCFYPAMSKDGRLVAFYTSASTLVENDDNGMPDVYVHDIITGITSIESISSFGLLGDGDVYWWPSLSGDGQYVAFESEAQTLVIGDTNQTSDIFVRDRQAGVTKRVSVDAAGLEANGMNSFPVISGNGRYVAFETFATNLVSDDTNGQRDVVVVDTQTGEIDRVSVSSSGEQANDSSERACISADGRYVGFASFASNLVSDDTNLELDVFLHDRETGVTLRASLASPVEQENGGGHTPSISDDGRWVAFTSASELLAVDGQGGNDVYLRDASGPAWPWLDMGSGLAGQVGIPALTGTGTVQPLTLVTLSLTGGLPFSPCFLVLGVSNLSAPFKGGVLVPYPNFMFGQTVDFFGKASFGGLWPSGIPSGFTVYFQYWIVDAAGPFGFAASNAVAGTTP